MKKYIFDYSKLKGKIAEKNLNLTELSKLSKINYVCLLKKFNNETEFKANEILTIADILKLDNVKEYFFKLKV